MWQLRSRFLTPQVRLGGLLLAVTAPFLAQTPVQMPAGSNGRFRVAGTILSASEGRPLSRARVSLEEVKNPQNQIFMITGDDGHFEFVNLHAGKYSLVGAKRGFITSAYDQHEQFSTAIVTGAGVDTENLILRIVPTAVLTGHVFDEFGEPVRTASGAMTTALASAAPCAIAPMRRTIRDRSNSRPSIQAPTSSPS
jgi:hypothetical protein